MTATLVVLTWLAGLGPHVAMQSFASVPACRYAMRAMTEMLVEQARTNLIGVHQPRAEGSHDEVAVIRTAQGREIARVRCVKDVQPDR